MSEFHTSFERYNLQTHKTDTVGITLDESSRVATCEVPCKFNDAQLRVNSGQAGVICTAIDLRRRAHGIDQPGNQPANTSCYPLCAFPDSASLPQS